MLDLRIPEIEDTFKMVKNKRDLKSPRRNRSFTGSRTGARLRQNVGTSRAGGNIRVVIRVRPFNERENTNNNRNVVKITDKNTIIFDPKEEDEPFFYHGVAQKNRDIMKRSNKNLNFSFDHVFGDDANNEIVFESSTKTLIETLMKGYNCSVFVYGATGAGKTHTMLGREEDPGITFLTLIELFKQKDGLLHEREFEIGVTYLEVYNETVKDLLNPGTPLSLREDGKFGVIVAGIKMQRIEQSNTLFELLEQGNKNRTQHPTDANAESSRSHAVFQVYLRMKFKATGELRASKLSMIDLAGSERGSATGYSGARFTEGANINKSLLALGNCINSLADGHRHVPYRDSKLTRLLKDSLGGNCQTVMIANVSPSIFNYEDTYNTLKYAMRAKKIKTTMKKNIVPSESSLNHYMQLVEQLTKENEELKLQLALSQKDCNCNATPEEKEKIEKPEPVPQTTKLVPEPVPQTTKLVPEPVLEPSQRDIQLQINLKNYYEEKKQLEHRILQLESTNHLATLRKQLKQEIHARISGICKDSPEKKQCRSRLVNAVDRLDRQTSTIQADIMLLKEQNTSIDERIKEILDANPQLKVKSEVHNAEVACMKAINRADHLQKVSDFQSGELRFRDQIIENFSDVLQSCFSQLRGHGLATEALTNKYNGLVRNLKGVRTVSWEEDSVESDSGISSTTAEQEDESCASKRKLFENPELNDTFVISEKKASLYKEQVKSKVFETIYGEDDEEVVTERTFMVYKDKSLEDEVFVNPDIPVKTKIEKVPTPLRNVCAEDMMFRVNKPNAQEVRVPPLPIRNLHVPSKPVTAKRLMTNVYKSPSRFPSSDKTQKENYKPYARHHLNKEKDRLKPSSARSTTSTASNSSQATVQNSHFK